MIVSFRHRGLKRFFVNGDARGIHPNHVAKVRRIMTRLHAAASPLDLAAPGLRLHQLKGDRQGTWAVDVDHNWRITFKFEVPDCCEVNYEDYH